MSRIRQVFEKGPVYVGFLVAGDGGLDYSLQSMLAMVEGGVDIIEIGMPFSDPVADGPTIQQATMRALSENITVDDIFQLVKKFRQHSDIPVIFFSYYNPVFIAMQQDFFAHAKTAGVDGCLLVDLPLEESDDYYQQCAAHQIDPIFLISPSTPEERIKQLSEKAQGMLYYVCQKGTTGARQSLPIGFSEKIAQIKAATKMPVVVGFGIADKKAANAVLEYADGFVVGSALVSAMAEKASSKELMQLVANIDPRQSEKTL